MEKRKLLVRLATLVFFIFIVNYIAKEFYWYSSIWWFDMLMHFLGGLWLGLVFIWLFFGKEINSKLFLKIILGVFLIGFFWEIFEIIVNNFTIKDSFNILDTISDLCFDVAGGIFALWYFYFSKRIMFKEKNKI